MSHLVQEIQAEFRLEIELGNCSAQVRFELLGFLKFVHRGNFASEIIHRFIEF